jgi:phosphatidate cytidylyltransferase
MSHLDPYHRPDDWADWPPREDPEDGDPTPYGRHRARHSAAPDPYAPHPQDDHQLPSTGTGWDQPTAEHGGTDWGRSAGEETGWGRAGEQSGWGRAGEHTGWGPRDADHTGTGWDRPTAEHNSASRLQSPEQYEIEQLLPAGGRAGQSRGRRRRGRGQGQDHNGAPVAGEASKSRAGRNLPAAIGVGLTLGAVVIAALFLWKPAFLGVIAVAMGVGIWELSRAVRHAGANPPLVPLLIGGVLMSGLAWYEGPDALSVGLLVTVLAAMVWRLADGPAGYQRDITAATLVAVYVPFLGGFAALLAEPGDGAKRVIITLAAVVLSDTGGYAAGVFLGRHPMAPSISPKKSWEGLGGSLVAAAVGGALMLYFVFDVAPWWGAVFGLAISVASVLGDLAESMLKRDLGVKDMSNLLPGHGGLMDRLDSILFAVPTAYLLLSVLAPVS